MSGNLFMQGRLRRTALGLVCAAVLVVTTGGAAIVGVSPVASATAPVNASCTVEAFTTTTSGVSTAVSSSDQCSVTSVSGTGSSPTYNIAWNHSIVGSVCPANVITGCSVYGFNISFEDFTPSGPSPTPVTGVNAMGCSFNPGAFANYDYPFTAWLLAPSYAYRCVANIVPDGRSQKFGVETVDGGANGTLTTYYIVNPGAAPAAPVAAFSASADATVPGQIDFDASASTPSTGASISSYAWNFGDGTPIVTTTTAQTSHVFATSGSQSVTLTVTDNKGQSATLTKQLEFPIASFTSTPDSSNPKLFTFDASGSTGAQGSPVVRYEWNFGDGSQPVTTSSPTVTHTFPGGGQFNVQLAVVDGSGLSSPVVTQQVLVAAYAVNSVGDAPSKDPTQAICDTGSQVTVGGATVPECTLRAAIQSMDAAGRGVITFNLPTATTTIVPTTLLPAVTASDVTVDGSTDPGGPVVLSGFNLGSSDPDLTVSGGNDTVMGLQTRSTGVGILINSTAGGDVVRGNVLGIPATGETCNPTLLSIGVEVQNSPDAVIGGTTPGAGNVISGANIGVSINGQGSSGAVVQGNLLGTTPQGTATCGDFEDVDVVDASNVQVGGATSTPGHGAGNVLVTNAATGVFGQPGGSASVLIGGLTANAANDTVQGNTIGLLGDGVTPATTGGLVGVDVVGRVSGAVIGGSAAGAGNVIDGSNVAQVVVDGTSVSGTQILGNLIGTDVTGQVAVPSSGASGVVVAGARTTLVGTAGAGRNVITGQQTGVFVKTLPIPEVNPLSQSTSYPGTNNPVPGNLSTLVSGNIVGPLANGTSGPTTPEEKGVVLAGSGDTLGPNNQISDNGVGVVVGTPGETVVGNLIGTDATGLAPLPNGTGVSVGDGSTSSFTLGVAGAKPNTISGNLNDVVLVSPTVVQNNQVGTTSLGNSAVPPVAVGSLPEGIVNGATVNFITGIDDGAAGSIIGGTQPGMGNVIGGIVGDGLDIQMTATVEGNKIGVGANGTSPVPNSGDGIFLASGSSGSQIGASPTVGAPSVGPWNPAPGPAGGNVIANNALAGVAIAGSVTGVSLVSDSLFGNTVGIKRAGSAVPGPAFASAPFQNGAGATDVPVDVGNAAPGTLVQVYVADSCQGSIQGRTLVSTDVVSSPGIVISGIPLQAVGTAIAVTLTSPSGVTSDYSCEAVVPQQATVTPSNVPAGQSVTVTGSGFTPGETVQATVHSQSIDLGTFTADAEGDVTFEVTLPASLEPGEHLLVLTGLSSGHTEAIAVTVTASPTTSPPAPTVVPVSSKSPQSPATSTSASSPTTSLPFTGLDVGAILRTGLLLLVVGALLVRRRRSAAH